jgi:PIN domain nuclease of toxin-antitoxin system
MILLDTHIWIHWMNGTDQLSPAQVRAIDQNGISGGIGVSPISCWEIALLTSYGRLHLNLPVAEWIGAAMTHPAVTIKQLTPRVAVESTQLPDLEHRDPADRFLIATARIHDCPLLTHDRTILAYPHVQTIG